MDGVNNGLIGNMGEGFVDYMQKLNQATNGSQSLPAGYNPDTVKSIISNKESQDLYDQMKVTAEINREKTYQINQTRDLDIYSDTGINTINKFAQPDRAPRRGQNVDISV